MSLATARGRKCWDECESLRRLLLETRSEMGTSPWLFPGSRRRILLAHRPDDFDFRFRRLVARAGAFVPILMNV
jgi:hypothetical protein